MEKELKAKIRLDLPFGIKATIPLPLIVIDIDNVEGLSSILGKAMKFAEGLSDIGNIFTSKKSEQENINLNRE